MTELESCPSPEMLEKLVDGLLNADLEAKLTLHLDSCERCREVVDGFGSVELINPPIRTDESKLFLSRLDKIRSNPPGASPSLNSGYVDVLPWLEHSETAIGKIAEFKLVRFIGRGGMGLVFEAFDEKLHREVAIKLMSPGLLADSHASERFLREARSAAQINHVNVVTIHGVDQTRGLPWLVMELIDGRSLDQQLKKSGQLPIREILKVAQQTALGLQAAHQRGITHRDIKPSNLMLDRNSKRIKIADFGLASSLNETSFTRSGMLVGTPDFASPEQVNSLPVDARSDLFSLGSVLYLLCTNSLPFSQDSLIGTLDAVRNETLPPANELNKDVPQGLTEIVQRLMEKDPADRYQTSDELLAAIENFAKSRNQNIAFNANRPIPESEAPWLVPVLVGLAVFGLLATFATAWFNWPKGSDERVANVTEPGQQRPKVTPKNALGPAPLLEEQQQNVEPPRNKETIESPAAKPEVKADQGSSEEGPSVPPVFESNENNPTKDEEEPSGPVEKPMIIETSEQLLDALVSGDDSIIALVPGRTYRIAKSIEVEERDLAIKGDPNNRPVIEFATKEGQPSMVIESGTLSFVGVHVQSDFEVNSEEPLVHARDGELNVEDSLVHARVEGPAFEIFNSELTISNSLLLTDDVMFGVEPNENQKISVRNSILVGITNFELGGSTTLRFVSEDSQFVNQQMFVMFEDNHEEFEIQFASDRCIFGSGDALFGIEAETAELREFLIHEFANRLKWNGENCILPADMVHSEFEEEGFSVPWGEARIKLDSKTRTISSKSGDIDDLMDRIHETELDSIEDVRKLIEREIR